MFSITFIFMTYILIHVIAAMYSHIFICMYVYIYMHIYNIYIRRALGWSKTRWRLRVIASECRGRRCSLLEKGRGRSSHACARNLCIFRLFSSVSAVEFDSTIRITRQKFLW